MLKIDGHVLVKVPFVLKVKDYHDFNSAKDIFKQAGVTLKFRECNNKYYPDYYAVFYQKKTDEVQKLIDDTEKKLSQEPIQLVCLECGMKGHHKMDCSRREYSLISNNPG